MAGAEWCIMLIFAGPIGDCCIILEPKLDEYVMGCASLLRTHGMLRMSWRWRENNDAV